MRAERQVISSLAALMLTASFADAAPVPICVDVVIKQMKDAPAKPPPGKMPPVQRLDQGPPEPDEGEEARPSQAETVYPYPPRAYLKRLIEYHVTHERGFTAVASGCTERIRVELYPLDKGWTAFARYSRFKVEEKVDRLLYDEFPRFAERVVLALLYNQDIDETANLKNILRADSDRDYRTVRGSHHFALTLGSAFRMGKLPTMTEDGAGYDNAFRLMTPIVLEAGYRGRFNAWGLNAFARGVIGLSKRSVLSNPGGGHTDLSGGFGLGLYFLRYHAPHGVSSFYYGGGATFDLSVFSVVRPEDQRQSDDRESVTGGGLNLNIVIGFEFMRASTVQFFIQMVAGLPVYVFDTEPEFTKIDGWIPEITAQVGMMF